MRRKGRLALGVLTAGLLSAVAPDLLASEPTDSTAERRMT